ncbi:uncharacterized protein LOC133919566 [Phragmites australis]|uniref:uncharacterized protein LOC133919566 n=1 Tax=Phragmites australis TaxID=29695 RepID=UPI002D78DD7E|nr:uncharacterized protein LOC133919566 [Phragmites australis]
MHRQLTLSPGPKQQQQEDDGSGSDAAQQMAVPEDSVTNSKADRARSARSIHLIPLLTFLCFLLLFLCSHDPSPSDMSSFGGGGNRRLRML